MRIDPEFRKVCPPLTVEEQASLGASILADGCRDPIVTWRGRLLDGHHRLRICREHGVDFRTVEVELANRRAALEWVARNALAHRNLSPAQRIDLAERLRDVLTREAAARMREGRARGGKTAGRGRSIDSSPPELADSKTDSKERREVNAQIGKLAGVGRETVRKYRETKDHLTGEERARLNSGDLSIDRAHRIARDRLSRRHREVRRASSAPREGDSYRVFQADIRDGLPEVGDASVDLIFADPPYARDYIPLYSALSRVAARILRPGGSLLAMAGQYYLPETMERLGEHLGYWWMICYVLPHPHTQVHERRVRAGWKPVLWFRRTGKLTGGYKYDVSQGGRAEERDFHVWQQNAEGVESLMRQHVNVGDVVLDPFLGSGTTGIAALAMGCRFLGSDVDGGCVRMAACRLAETAAGDQAA